MNAWIFLWLAAVEPTIGEQLKGVPKQVWINIGICVLAVIITIKVWRGLRKINEFFPYIAAALAAFLIFFYWIYERSEPAFLTPVVEKLAPFFPSKTQPPPGEDARRRKRTE